MDSSPPAYSSTSTSQPFLAGSRGQVGCVRASQVRGNGYTEGAQEGKGPVETEWWRAGGRGAGSQPLVALEVIKPLMRQDLERLSDKVRF